MQAAEDFACQLRPLTAPKGDRNGEIASSVDRTEFAVLVSGNAVQILGCIDWRASGVPDRTV
ncbi:MAG: hypothetical protein V9G12_20815 [Microthrixaceae bacterium]